MNRSRVLFTVFVLICISCSTYEQNKNMDYKNTDIKQHSNIDINEFISNPNVKRVENIDSTKLLFIQETQLPMDEHVKNIEIIVTDIALTKILYKNSFDRSSAKWLNQNEILITKELGFYDKKTNKSYQNFIINLNTKKTRKYDETFKNY